MGYIKKKIGDISNVPYVTFECDTVADVAAIDVSNVVMGSRCYVVDTGTTYALNSDGEWKEVPIGGGASSWNDLEDKPFYEETVTTVTPGLNITWDGNTSGLAMFTVGREKLYHVSDLTPALEQLQTAEIIWSNINTGEPNGDIWYGSEYTVIENTEQVLTLSKGGARGAGAIGVVYNESYGYPTGMYLPFFFGDVLFVSSLTSPDVVDTSTELKKLDKKYLPEALQFGEVKEEEVVHFNGVIPSSNSKISDERFIKLGKEYVVTFDDVEYVCVAYDNNREPTLGGTFSDFSNYPFTIFQGAEVWIGTEASGQHNLSIVEKIKNITTIDPKYLPQTDGGGIEAVHLYIDDRLTNVSIAHNLHYGTVEGGNYARFEEATEMTKAEADELYNKWIRGMARIFVFESSLSNGGSENFFEVVQLRKMSINSTGTYYDIYGTFMRFGTEKEFKLA